MSALPRIVAETPIGKEVNVEVWRKGKRQSLKAMVGELDESDAQVASAGPTPKETPNAAKNERSLDLLGLKVAPLTPELRQRFDIKDDAKGVVITDVTAEGPAGKKDLRPGDVIVEVAQSEVKSPEEVAGKVKEVQDAKRRSVLLLIQRQGDLSYIAVPFKG